MRRHESVVSQSVRKLAYVEGAILRYLARFYYFIFVMVVLSAGSTYFVTPAAATTELDYMEYADDNR